MENVIHHTPISAILMSAQNYTTQSNTNISVTPDLNGNSSQPDKGDGDICSPFNNPWNVISAATAEKWTQVLNYLFVLFLAVGVPANVTNCLVFYRQVWTGASIFVH